MTAINHAFTGAAIGLLSGNPWLAIPAALLSHFVCDALPHYGSTLDDTVLFRTRRFKIMLAADALLCALLVLALALSRPHHWLLASVCAFLATSPDLLWFGRFRRAQHHALDPQRNWFLRFAGVIQWFQRPIGAAVELAWLAAGLLIVGNFIV